MVVNGKALFGPYRHVLERRGEAVLDAALSLWEPYVVSILKALDGMPAEAEVDLPLLVRATTQKPRCPPSSLPISKGVYGRRFGGQRKRQTSPNSVWGCLPADWKQVTNRYPAAALKSCCVDLYIGT